MPIAADNVTGPCLQVRACLALSQAQRRLQPSAELMGSWLRLRHVLHLKNGTNWYRPGDKKLHVRAVCWWVFWHQDASCSDAGGVPGIGAVPFDYVHSPRQTGRIQMPWMSQNVAFLSSAAGAFRAWDSDRGRSRIRQI